MRKGQTQQLLVSFIGIIIILFVIQVLRNLTCESYCKILLEKEKPKWIEEGYSRGYYKGYSVGCLNCSNECYNLLNSTNENLRSCQNELKNITRLYKKCRDELNRTVDLTTLLNYYYISPYHIVVKQLLTTFTLTIGLTISLIEVTIEIFVRRKKNKYQKVFERFLTVIIITLILVVISDYIIKIALILSALVHS